MPPKVKFSRQVILDAAVQQVRQEGIDALTTREIAKRLGSSTRPIFTAFASMEELKSAVSREAREIYQSYLREGKQHPSPFLGMGIAYIRFAKTEPRLYSLLFLTGSGVNDTSAFEEMQLLCDEATEGIMENYSLTRSEAELYCRNMWLVAHSIACLVVSGDNPYGDEEISKILTSFSLANYKAIREIEGFAEGKYNPNSEFSKIKKYGLGETSNKA